MRWLATQDRLVQQGPIQVWDDFEYKVSYIQMYAYRRRLRIE